MENGTNLKDFFFCVEKWGDFPASHVSCPWRLPKIWGLLRAVSPSSKIEGRILKRYQFLKFHNKKNQPRDVECLRLTWFLWKFHLIILWLGEDLNHLPGENSHSPFGSLPLASSLELPSPRAARPAARRCFRQVFRHLATRWRFSPHSLGRRDDLRHHSKHVRWHACNASTHPPKRPLCPWVLVVESLNNDPSEMLIGWRALKSSYLQ